MNDIKTPLGGITTKEPDFFADDALNSVLRPKATTRELSEVTIPVVTDPLLENSTNQRDVKDSFNLDHSEIKISANIPQTKASDLNLNSVTINQNINIDLLLSAQNKRFMSASLDAENFVPAYQVNPFVEIRERTIVATYTSGEKPKIIGVDYSKISEELNSATINLQRVATFDYQSNTDSKKPEFISPTQNKTTGIKSGIQTKSQTEQDRLNAIISDENAISQTIKIKERAEKDEFAIKPISPEGTNLENTAIQERIKKKLETGIVVTKQTENKGKFLDELMFNKEIKLEDRFKPNEDSQTFLDELVSHLARLWYQLMQWLEKMLKKLRKWLLKDYTSIFHFMLGKKKKDKEEEELEEKLELEKLRRKMEKERQKASTSRE